MRPAFLEEELLGHSVARWLVAVAIFAVVTGLLMVLRPVGLRAMRHLAARLPTRADDHVAAALERTRGFFLVALGVYPAVRYLDPGSRTERLVEVGVILALLAQLGIWTSAFLGSAIEDWARRKTAADPGAATGLAAVRVLALSALWVAVGLVALDNIGVNVTAFVAGLGITGIAVALAVQNVLGDLFASISIVLDKPFVEGDFIVVGTDMGTVERVGLKTTRVRSTGGEQLIFANADLLKSRVRNFRRMAERRVTLTFGVAYGAPPEVLDAVPGMIREVVEGLPCLRFERAHLKALGPAELQFEVGYVVEDPDGQLHLDRQHAILLALYRRLLAQGVVLSSPTRTVFVHLQEAQGRG